MISTLNEPQQKGVLTVCLMAAFADGTKNEAERTEVKRIIESVSSETLNPPALYQDVLLQRVSLADAVTSIDTPELRTLAYEMAVCVCEADDALNESEKTFLTTLRTQLNLDAQPARTFQQEAEAISLTPLEEARAGAVPPVIASGGESDHDLDQTILNYSILNGALEVLPNSLATMAIIPIQMKMVYRIGKRYGFDLDRGHIKEFFATAGVGMGSQVLEGFARKFLGGLAGKLGGGLLRAGTNLAVSSGMSFASTYALGHMARRYYAGGRTLSGAQLKQLFTSLLNDARGVSSRYTGEIQERASRMNVARLLPMLRNQ